MINNADETVGRLTQMQCTHAAQRLPGWGEDSPDWATQCCVLFLPGTPELCPLPPHPAALGLLLGRPRYQSPGKEARAARFNLLCVEF